MIQIQNLNAQSCKKLIYYLDLLVRIRYELPRYSGSTYLYKQLLPPRIL